MRNDKRISRLEKQFKNAKNVYRISTRINSTFESLDNMPGLGSVSPKLNPYSRNSLVARDAAGNTLQRTKPFMKFPLEYRLLIYELTPQDILDDTVIDELESPRYKLHPLSPYVGTLPLLQTSKELRSGDFCVMKSLVEDKTGRLAQAVDVYFSKKSVELEESYYCLEERFARLDAFPIAIGSLALLSRLVSGKMLVKAVELPLWWSSPIFVLRDVAASDDGRLTVARW